MAGIPSPDRLVAARAAVRAAPGDPAARRRLARRFGRAPAEAEPGDAPLLLDLLRDPLVDPAPLAPAGWALVAGSGYLPSAAARDRYTAEHPADPWCRDFDAMAAFERRHPRLYSGMYRFWCARPA
ncbi:MAG: hypothetical protein V4472_00020 [Pseudomonadota bacterium]